MNKNIFILPTDKPSRLGRFIDTNNLVLKTFYELSQSSFNIFITSDEEIKEGDYGLIGKEVGKIILTEDGYEFLIGKGVSYEYGDYYSLQKVCKKIILTTDQDLIKDSVQAIDDEFLEWFVKNPSCEFVEVVKGKMQLNDDGQEYGFPDMSLYKIIIPKEKPKKEVTGVDDNRPKPNYCYAKEQGHGEIGCVFPACHCGLPIKQETLEEVEENIDREEWINFFKNNSKEEILEYLINYKFPL
jgi:hypothetical protein